MVVYGDVQVSACACRDSENVMNISDIRSQSILEMRNGPQFRRCSMPSWPATSMPYRCAGPAAPPFRSITTAAVVLDAEDVVLAEMSGAARQTNPGRWLASPSPKKLSCKACLAAQLADAAHLIDSFFADFGHHFPILMMLTFEGGSCQHFVFGQQ
jgi:hypothetical protein